MSTIDRVGLFVRKVRTASGATAVQIVSKERGVRRIVEHIGSAHSPEELAVLLEVADTKLHAGQLAFDLSALAPAKVSAVPDLTRVPHFGDLARRVVATWGFGRW